MQPKIKVGPVKLKTPILRNQPTLTIKQLGDPNFSFSYIVHISDIHIPLNLHKDRKDEFLHVFNLLYQKLSVYKEQNLPFVIVITGDIIHVKQKIEAETHLMARNLLKALS